MNRKSLDINRIGEAGSTGQHAASPPAQQHAQQERGRQQQLPLPRKQRRSSAPGAVVLQEMTPRSTHRLREMLAAAHEGALANSAAGAEGEPHRLDPEIKAQAEELIRRKEYQQWCSVRGKQVPPPPLQPAILRTIREW